MEHLAIDLGGKESQICVRSSDGRIVEERRRRRPPCPRTWPAGPRAASSSRPGPSTPSSSGALCTYAMLAHRAQERSALD
jgi:hypothetical protein